MIPDYEGLYSSYVGKFKITQNGRQAIGLCPFHDDHHPSLSMSMETGLYHCHSCGVKGNAYQFAAEKNHPNPSEWIERNGEQQTMQNIEPKITYSDLLDRAKGYQQNFPDELLENELWAKDLLIGLDSQKRITFPYFDKNGNVIGIKHHKGKNGKKPYWEGDGTCKWYGQQLIKGFDRNKSLYICEGEKDYLWILSLGFQAICGSAGAGSIPKDLSPVTGFVEVIIIYDHDKAGNEGAKKLAERMTIEFGKPVKIAQWRNGLHDGYDISDDAKNGFEEMDYAVTNSREYHLPRRGTLIMKHSELLDADFIKPDPIIDEILVEQGITLLTGTDNTGKSPLATQMGICIAMGIPFLGYSVPEPRKVLIYQFENPNGEHKARMVMQDGYFKKTYPEKAHLLGQNLYHRIIEEERDFINHWDKINDTLSEHPDLKVLVVDNLYTSTNVNISDNHELIKLLSDINQTVRKHNVALILLAHHVKKDKELTELDKFLIRGGKSLTDFCSNVLQIHTSSLNEELRLFKITKIRILHDEDGVSTKMVPQLITIDHKHFIAHSRTVTTCEAVHFNTSDKSKELEAVMLWHGYNDAPFTTNEWVNNVVLEKGIWSEATAKRRLKGLVKWGWLKKLSYGKYQVNWKAVSQASKYDKK